MRLVRWIRRFITLTLLLSTLVGAWAASQTGAPVPFGGGPLAKGLVSIPSSQAEARLCHRLSKRR